MPHMNADIYFIWKEATSHVAVRREPPQAPPRQPHSVGAFSGCMARPPLAIVPANHTIPTMSTVTEIEGAIAYGERSMMW